MKISKPSPLLVEQARLTGALLDRTVLLPFNLWLKFFGLPLLGALKETTQI